MKDQPTDAAVASQLNKEEQKNAEPHNTLETQNLAYSILNLEEALLTFEMNAESQLFNLKIRRDSQLDDTGRKVDLEEPGKQGYLIRIRKT